MSTLISGCRSTPWQTWLVGLLLAAQAAIADTAVPASSIDAEWRERFVMGHFADTFKDLGVAQRRARVRLDAARRSGDLREHLRAAANYFLVAGGPDLECAVIDQYLQMAIAAGEAYRAELFDIATSATNILWDKPCERLMPLADLERLAHALGDPARMYFVLQAAAPALSIRDQVNEVIETRVRQLSYAIAPFQRVYCLFDIAQSQLRADAKNPEGLATLERAIDEPLGNDFIALRANMDAMVFRYKHGKGDVQGALKAMTSALPHVRSGALGSNNSAFWSITFAQAMGREGRLDDALALLRESERFGATDKGVSALRSLTLLRILSQIGTPDAYERGLREIQNIDWLLSQTDQFGPQAVRIHKVSISKFHEKFGKFGPALAALKAANEAAEEFQKRASEQVRVELQEKLKVAAKDRENAQLKADAELQAARQRGWIVAFGAAAAGVAAAGMALAVAVRRGRRLAQVSIELAQRNGELEQRSASRIRLLAAACHDLRQPAHALGLLAELGSDAQQEPSRFVAWLQSVRRSTASLSDMLDELMDLGRLDSGHYTAQLADVSVGELLQEVMLHFGGLAKRKGLALEVPPFDAVVVSDRHLLRRIVFNLVSNAIKYTDAGFVRVKVRREGDALQLSVRDSGPGIPQDRLDDVFRDYVRLNPTQAAEGLGIGLSIVRRAAELLGHGLSLISPPGQGTTVSLRMTLSERQPQAEAGTSAGRATEAAQGVLVLLENDIDVREAMTALAQRWGYIVQAGPDAASVLAPLQAGSLMPDLIITDLHLDGVNGLAEVATLREALRAPALPALLVTGDLDAAIASQAAQAQVYVAHKPLAPRKLAALLHDLLHTPAPEAGPHGAMRFAQALPPA